MNMRFKIIRIFFNDSFNLPYCLENTWHRYVQLVACRLHAAHHSPGYDPPLPMAAQPFSPQHSRLTEPKEPLVSHLTCHLYQRPSQNSMTQREKSYESSERDTCPIIPLDSLIVAATSCIYTKHEIKTLETLRKKGEHWDHLVLC